jgi:hypothetical protein
VVADDLGYEAPGHRIDLDGYFLLDFSSRPGNSGGAVIDADGRVIGLVAIRSTDGSGRLGTAVLPVSVINGFLKVKDPKLWARLFDRPAENVVSSQTPDRGWPVDLDRHPAPAEGASDSNILTAALQAGVAASLAAMRGMIARQDIRSWGDGTREQTSQYEVAMYSDGQRFLSGTGKELSAAALPAPKAGILPESEWYDTLSLMSKVRLEYVGASLHSGEPVHVFAFHDSPSDKTCRFHQRTATLFGPREKEDYVACEGSIVSDEHFNVLGIALRLSPRFGTVAEWHALARYGLIQLHDRPEPHLLPLNMEVSARLNNGRVYHASEGWSGYHLFASKSTLRDE